MIHGRTYRYHRLLDLIYYDSWELGAELVRTQVNEIVDLCIEVTSACNLFCVNCFGDCGPHRLGKSMPSAEVVRLQDVHRDAIVRLALTGGEPLLHPEAEALLELPQRFPECGYVLYTNGSVRFDLDKAIIANQWLAAVSLHGRRASHNRYTRSDSFDTVARRIADLAPQTPVHIYATLHEDLTEGDLEWLVKFRDESGAKFLRLIVPRMGGRHGGQADSELATAIAGRPLDQRAAVKRTPSLTTFVTVSGEHRPSR